MNEPLSLDLAADITDLPPDSILIATHCAGEQVGVGGALEPLGGARLHGAVGRGETRGALFDVTIFHSDGSSPGLAIAGAGPRSELDPVRYARLAAAVSRLLTGRGYRRLAWLDDGVLSPEMYGRAVAEGLVRGAYNSELRKSAPGRRRTLERITLVSVRDAAGIAREMVVGQTIGECAAGARDLTNLPPNELTPLGLAWHAEELAREHGLGIEVLDEKKMDELGMGALLAVAQGSALPPRLIHAWLGDRDAPVRLAFVGKGLTFDTGGLHIKPIESMRTMKHDMAGAAAALMALVACARLKLSGICVEAYLAAAENMIGPRATRPGDVVTAYNGKTIEIVDPDSEGRLVLADAMAYAVSQGATNLVDVATLTMGATIALGHAATLAAGQPREWVTKVALAGDDGLEPTWPMPIMSEHRRAMDSDIADIKNSGGRAGSALNASAFLREFVGEVPWAHLDIAATSWTDEPRPYQPRGATGAGVGTLVQLARTMDAQATQSRSSPP